MSKWKKRYLSLNDKRGVTESQLKRLSKKKQIEYLTYWFDEFYEDPIYETKQDEDGDFIWNHGGPFNAKEALTEEFEDFIREDRIEEAVELVEITGTSEWAPSWRHPQYEDGDDDEDDKDNKGGDEEELATEEAKPLEKAAPTTDRDGVGDELARVASRLEGGFRPTFGDPEEVAQRREILEKIEELLSTLGTRPSPGIGHNNPPPDDDLVQMVAAESAKDAAIAIRLELSEPEPDAQQVVAAAAGLKKALGWLGAKLNTAAESFAKALGGAAAAATVLAVSSPSTVAKLHDLFHATVNWLSMLVP